MEINVINKDLLTTIIIELVHLNEFEDYYNKEYGLLSLQKIKQINQNK